MKYQIFELIPKSRLERDGYYTKTVVKYILEQTELSVYPDSYDSFINAEDYIKSNADRFKNQTLTILPIIEVDYKGKIKDD